MFFNVWANFRSIKGFVLYILSDLFIVLYNTRMSHNDCRPIWDYAILPITINARHGNNSSYIIMHWKID